jgi:hypothetical protein
LQNSETLSPFFSATSTLFARMPEISVSSVIMSLFRYIVTPIFPARNLIARPIILWRRDTEPFPSAVGVYFGSQGFVIANPDPQRFSGGKSCNPLLLQNF